MALGKRVRYYRSKLGLTLEALAEKTNVDVGTLSALEMRDSQRSKYTAQPLHHLHHPSAWQDVRSGRTPGAPDSINFVLHLLTGGILRL